MKALNLADNFSYLDVDDNAVFDIIAAVREGIKFGAFTKLAAKFPFSLTEWSVFLHLSERTIQRMVQQLRDHGTPIIFNRARGSYELHEKIILE